MPRHDMSKNVVLFLTVTLILFGRAWFQCLSKLGNHVVQSFVVFRDIDAHIEKIKINSFVFDKIFS